MFSAVASESTLFDCSTRAAVALAVDAHRGVRVRGPGLQRRRQGDCVLLVLGLLADRLDAVARAAALVALRPDPDPRPASTRSGSARSRRSRRCSTASTLPSSPLLSTRTGVFVLLAPFCAASEAANASCSFFASWPIAWIPPEPRLILIRVLLGQRSGSAPSRRSRRCSTARPSRRRPCCRHAPECSCCSPRTAARPTGPLRPARSWLPGRSPGCRPSRSHSPCPCRPDPDPHPAWSGSGWQRSRRNRRCSTASTLPSSPLLSTRTGVFVLLAPCCARTTGRTRPARSSPPGRSPGCRRRTDPDPRPASSAFRFAAVASRVDAVRLLDRAAVALAVDTHRRVGVAARGATALVAATGLGCQRRRRRVLVVLRLLADRLDAVGRAAAILAAALRPGRRPAWSG